MINKKLFTQTKLVRFDKNYLKPEQASSSSSQPSRRSILHQENIAYQHIISKWIHHLEVPDGMQKFAGKVCQYGYDDVSWQSQNQLLQNHLNASFTASWTNKIGQESGQTKHVLSKNCKQYRVKVLKLSQSDLIYILQ